MKLLLLFRRADHRVSEPRHSSLITSQTVLPDEGSRRRCRSLGETGERRGKDYCLTVGRGCFRANFTVVSYCFPGSPRSLCLTQVTLNYEMSSRPRAERRPTGPTTERNFSCGPVPDR